MTNITKYPLIDWFETTLAQERDGATWLVYLNTVPEFTFPAWVTTYIVVDPGKTKMQVAEINAIDSGAKTVTVSDITLEKGASVNYTQQTHSVWSVVRISDNYVFWKALATAINTKLDSDGDWTRDSATDFAWLTAKSLTTAQRDALTATNGMIIYNTTTGVLDQYIGWAWTQFASGTTPNASETVAGKVEVATSAEFNAWTDTGGTWASLVAVPSQIKAKNDSQDSSISTNAWNISTNSTNISTNASDITTLQWQVPIVTNVLTNTFLIDDVAQSDVTLAHWLWRVPRLIIFRWDATDTTFGMASYDWSTITQKTLTLVWWYDNHVIRYQWAGIDRGDWTITAIDATNITLSYSFGWWYTSFNAYSIITVIW